MAASEPAPDGALPVDATYRGAGHRAGPSDVRAAGVRVTRDTDCDRISTDRGRSEFDTHRSGDSRDPCHSTSHAALASALVRARRGDSLSLLRANGGGAVG